MLLEHKAMTRDVAEEWRMWHGLPTGASSSLTSKDLSRIQSTAAPHVPTCTSLSTARRSRVNTLPPPEHPLHPGDASTRQHQPMMDYDTEGGAVNVRFLQVHRPLTPRRRQSEG